jgi:hypothetical protein
VSRPTVHHNRPQTREQLRAKKLDVICKMSGERRRTKESSGGKEWGYPGEMRFGERVASLNIKGF